MKAIILSIVSVCVLVLTSGFVLKRGEVAPMDTQAKSPGILTISFDFERGSKASNQYAIWVEDGQGKLLKTIYATSFTAKGGYKNKPMSIPAWVAKANLPELSEAQIDGFTSATPTTGKQSYYWDGTDNAGNILPEGEYDFFIEGTLYLHDKIMISGKVKLGSTEQKAIPLSTDLTAETDNNRNMLTNIKASYLPTK